MYYLNAITLGSQKLKPPGPPERGAAQLAAAEAARLRLGDLWLVDEDMCDLLSAAHPTMPAFCPRPADLPSRAGFTIFAKPIAAYPTEEAADHEFEDQLDGGTGTYRPVADAINTGDTRIVAVTWSEVDKPHWSAGGLWMSFYTPAAVHYNPNLFSKPIEAQRARSMLPRFIVDNEAAFAWRPEGARRSPTDYTFCDSQGLSELIHARHTAMASGTELILMDPSDQLRSCSTSPG